MAKNIATKQPKRGGIKLPDIDLFGVPYVVPIKRRSFDANGYAAQPGGGPAGETCKTCEFKIKIRGGGKSYWKCLKFHSPRTAHQWSGSISSDIRLKSPACRFWEQALSKTPIEPQRTLRRRHPFEIKEAR